jgi:hypothetical protein
MENRQNFGDDDELHFSEKEPTCEIKNQKTATLTLSPTRLSARHLLPAELLPSYPSLSSCRRSMPNPPPPT